MEITTRRIKSIHRVTALVTLSAVAFYLFFVISKAAPFRDINPFGDDPYDAVGSFGFQVALVAGILTYARALRLRESHAQAAKLRLILRGNMVVLFAILVTLVADAVAEIVRPFPPSYWGAVLDWGLVLMFVLCFSSVTALVAVFRQIRTPATPPNLTPADGLDDLWTLVCVPVTRAAAMFPPRFVGWVQAFHSDRLFSMLPWTNPRHHPWRFACALGAAAGVGLSVAHLQEGLPPSFAIFLLITAIFICFEFTAALAGFLALGGYLGLRPSLFRSKRAPFAPLLFAALLFGCSLQPDNPLIGAARSGDTQAIATLVSHGADPNQRWGVNGWTPLMHAIHKNQKGSVAALLTTGADVNARGNAGMTALIMAAGYGYADIVQLLLDHGADPYAETTDGDSALTVAIGGVPDIDKFTVGKCQTDTVAALLKKVPNLQLKDNFHGRAARLAVQAAGCVDVLSLLDRKPVQQFSRGPV
jgi:hypothetical protein